MAGAEFVLECRDADVVSGARHLLATFTAMGWAHRGRELRRRSRDWFQPPWRATSMGLAADGSLVVRLSRPTRVTTEMAP